MKQLEMELGSFSQDRLQILWSYLVPVWPL